MRKIQLDQELFLFKLDYAQYTFYLKHRDVIKKFWTDQGQTFWLRVLVTFKVSFEVYVSKHPKIAKFLLLHYEENIPNFIYAQIHKHFIENTFVEVNAFLDSVFTTLQLTNDVPVTFHSEQSYALFCEAVKHRDKETYLHDAVLTLLCIMLCGFTDGFLILLKKWLEEPDLSKKAEKNIDLTLYYWRPMNNWEDKNFIPCCFEKYLSSYWKEALPKLLLTCNIHNIFNSHNERNGCCNLLKNELSPFGILSKYQEKKSFQMNYLYSIKPGEMLCPKHKNCNSQIIHLEECTEPYICTGRSPCLRTCETVINTVKIKDYKEFWKESFVEVFKTKKGKKRHVSTFVESHDTPLVTFCPVNINNNKKICSDLEELFCSAFDSNLRNSYSQHKRKEDYRQKLRKKLQEKSTFDFQDSEQLKKMHYQAQRKFLRHMCCDNFKEYFASGAKQLEFSANLFKMKKSLTTVAIGTSGIIFGQVVLPSKHIFSQRREGTFHHETKTCIQHLPAKKTSKKKNKKKAEASSIKSDVKLVDETVTESVSNLCHDESKIQDERTMGNMLNTISECYRENNNDAVSKYTSPSNETESETHNDQTMRHFLSFQTLGEARSTDIPSVQASIDAVPGKTNTLVDETATKSTSNSCEAESKTQNNLTMDDILSLLTIDETESIDIIPDALASKDALSEKHNELDNDFTKSASNLCEAKFETQNGLTMDDMLSLLTLDETEPENHDDVDVPSDDELDVYMKFLNSNDDQEDSTTKKQISLDVSETQAFSNTPTNTVNTETTSPVLEQNLLQSCANCFKKEVRRLTFKRCSRCKTEKFPDQYYYCSRECQLADWRKSHKKLHEMKNKI